MGPKGVRVNSITPGFFPRNKNRKLLFHDDGSPTPRTKSIFGAHSHGPLGEATELVGAALFLASPQSQQLCHGARYPVDGGFLAQTI